MDSLGRLLLRLLLVPLGYVVAVVVATLVIVFGSWRLGEAAGHPDTQAFAMGGQALTGTELAYLARVSRPTASEHLLKLVEARLVAVIKQGRFCYYRIASPLVARMSDADVEMFLWVLARSKPHPAAPHPLLPR